MGSLIAVQLPTTGRPRAARQSYGHVRAQDRASSGSGRRRRSSCARSGATPARRFATAHYAMLLLPGRGARRRRAVGRIEPFIAADFAERDGAMLARSGRPAWIRLSELLPGSTCRSMRSRSRRTCRRRRSGARGRRAGAPTALPPARAARPRLGLRPPPRPGQRLPARILELHLPPRDDVSIPLSAQQERIAPRGGGAARRAARRAGGTGVARAAGRRPGRPTVVRRPCRAARPRQVARTRHSAIRPRRSPTCGSSSPAPAPASSSGVARCCGSSRSSATRVSTSSCSPCATAACASTPAAPARWRAHGRSSARRSRSAPPDELGAGDDLRRHRARARPAVPRMHRRRSTSSPPAARGTRAAARSQLAVARTWRLDERDLHDPLNLWLEAGVHPDGALWWRHTPTAAGDHVELLAQVDLLAIVYPCANDIFGLRRFDVRPVRCGDPTVLGRRARAVGRAGARPARRRPATAAAIKPSFDLSAPRARRRRGAAGRGGSGEVARLRTSGTLGATTDGEGPARGVLPLVGDHGGRQRRPSHARNECYPRQRRLRHRQQGEQMPGLLGRRTSTSSSPTWADGAVLPRVLGLPLLFPYVREDGWAGFQAGDVSIYLIEVGGDAPTRRVPGAGPAGIESFAFAVDDLDAAIADLDEAGVEWAAERRRVGRGTATARSTTRRATSCTSRCRTAASSACPRRDGGGAPSLAAGGPAKLARP